MTAAFTLACVQTNAGNEMGPNLDQASKLVRAARADGAELIAMPECVSMMEPRRRLIHEKASDEDSHPALKAFRSLAGDTGAWLLVGSLTVVVDAEKVANRSFLINPDGSVVARYDKLHMFDVKLPDGETYTESAVYKPGGSAVTAEMPWGRLGMTVCYDVRFPHLYRTLAQAGADFISVPSAFTRQTGEAHWHVLLRARAIETGCYVFAPAQCGEHPGNRKTYGHSLIVDPWGRVLADGGEAPGYVTAEIDPEKVAAARRAMPSLTHDRPFSMPEVPNAPRRRAAAP